MVTSGAGAACSRSRLCTHPARAEARRARRAQRRNGWQARLSRMTRAARSRGSRPYDRRARPGSPPCEEAAAEHHLHRSRPRGRAGASATRTSATTSPASRSRIEAATASSAASASTSGASSTARLAGDAAEVDRLGEFASESRARSARGQLRSSVVRGPRPSSLRAAAETAAAPRSGPPPQSPVVQPSAGKRAWRPSGATPTQLMPCAADDGDAPAAARCRRGGRRRCRCRRRCRRAQPRRRGLLVRALHLDREVDAGDEAAARRRPPARLPPRRAPARRARRSRSMAGLEPDVVRASCRAAREARAARRPRGRARGRSSSPPSAASAILTPPPPAGAATRRARPPARSWPISGCASSASRTVRGSRVTAASAVKPLVGGDVLDEPEQLRRERRLRQRLRPRLRHARRHLDDVVVGEPGERARVAQVDLVDGAVAGEERRDEPNAPPRCRRRRRAARAAPASRSAPGRGTAPAAAPRSSRPSARAARRRAARRARGRARRSSGGSRTAPRRAPRAARSGEPACSASASPCSREQLRTGRRDRPRAPRGSRSGG